uniref:Uncharacterized protein n=1 Tax=Lotus japonicus TaxID=34305 RepID=I3STT6_LOTJA|nr:unknown [Lotus japonicus]
MSHQQLKEENLKWKKGRYILSHTKKGTQPVDMENYLSYHSKGATPAGPSLSNTHPDCSPIQALTIKSSNGTINISFTGHCDKAKTT